MNKLDTKTQAQIIKCLCEGNSIRSTARLTDTAINTVIKLLKQVGHACAEYEFRNMKNLPCKTLQCDEIWSFCYAKENNIPKEHKGQLGYGDIWTFTAIDADTKLVPAWHVGMREPEDAWEFMNILKSRLTHRIQLTTDGHRMYYQAVDDTFGDDIDFGMMIKFYGRGYDETHRYSPPRCTRARAKLIKGKPDKSKISTSYIERQNLTMRMNMRRFTRLTNAFSKKLENHLCAIALYFMHYNFVKTHKALAYPYPRTPAMASGVTDHIWSYEELVYLVN